MFSRKNSMKTVPVSYTQDEAIQELNCTDEKEQGKKKIDRHIAKKVKLAAIIIYFLAMLCIVIHTGTDSAISKAIMLGTIMASSSVLQNGENNSGSC